MTSQLASQLKRLQQRPVDDKQLADSFLFDAADARSFSREQIHELAVHGLRTLISIDNRLHPFLDQLFHPHRTRVERKLLADPERRALDDAVDRFLTLLSPHLFLTAAHQVFEYLVRVHEVHVYNIPAVLRAFLPYHDHSLFARAVQLLDVRDTGFDFLSSHQLRGAPLLREPLVRACADSRRALRLLCDAFAAPARSGISHAAANALFAGVAARLAANAKDNAKDNANAEAQWRVLLPIVMEFAGGAAERAAVAREAACSALIALAAWSGAVRMSAATLATIARPIIAAIAHAAAAAKKKINAADDTRGGGGSGEAEENDEEREEENVPTMDLLAVVSLLFDTQRAAVEQITFAPVLQSLLALPWPQWSAKMSAETPRRGQWGKEAKQEKDKETETEVERGKGMYEALVSVLLNYCLARLGVAHSLRSVAPDVRAFAQCAATALTLSAPAVTLFITRLITSPLIHAPRASGEDEEEEPTHKDTNEAAAADESVMARWLCALERRYPLCFDAALSSLLRDSKTQLNASAFLARHLRGARYEVVNVPAAAAASGRLPLFACLLHPLPDARRVAAETMTAMPINRLVAGNALLPLLAHVAAYENCERVAVQFVHCAREAALKMLRFVGERQTERTARAEMKKAEVEGEEGEEEEDEEQHQQGEAWEETVTREDIGDVDTRLRELAQALWTMTTLHHNSNMRQVLLESFLQPLLQFSPARAPAKENKKRSKKSSKASPVETEEESTRAVEHARHLALYYATLLYVFVVDSNADTEADGVLRELLEKLITDAVSSPIERSPNGLFTLAPGAPSIAQQSTRDKHMDEDEKTDKAHLEASTAPSCLDVFACVPLMRALSNESALRLPATLRAMRTERAAPRALQLECCLSASSRFIGAETAAEADALVDELLRFFSGHLRRLHETALAEQQQQKRIGRGAAAAPLESLRDAIMEKMGIVVRRGVGIRLTNSETCGDLAQSARLLCYLRAPLLPAAVHLAQLPPAYLSLLPVFLSEESNSFPVDWFEVVFTALFAPVTKSDVIAAGGNKNTTGAEPSLSALALLLLCPFAAPPARRLAALQRLQDAVIRCSAAGSEQTAAQLIFAACVKSKGPCAASVTTLGCLIESMAVEESRGKLTDAAAKLICRMMADSAVPRAVALRAVEHFFPASRGTSSGTNHKHSGHDSSANISFAALLPALTETLAIGGSAGGTAAVHFAAADFLQAVCSRLDLCRAAETNNAARADESASAEFEAALQLCVLLLRHPFLRVLGGKSDNANNNNNNSNSVRAVYRPALSAFAIALSRELNNDGDARIFVPARAPAKAKAKAAKAECALDFVFLAETVSRALFDDGALARLGGDAARLLLATRGGYERIFRPFVSQRKSHGYVSLLTDALEALVAGPEEGDWEPPAACALAIPLRSADARNIIDMCREEKKTAAVWEPSEASRDVFRLLSAVVAAVPFIRQDEDEDDDDSNDGDQASPGKSGDSLFELISDILDAFPLGVLKPFFTKEGEETVVAACRRGAMAFIRSVVGLCVSSPQTLNESKPHGAVHIARVLVKQAVVLMAALLVDEETGDGDFSKQRVDTIAELLRLMSPLFTSVHTSTSTSNTSRARDSSLTTALHIPVVALLIRLESVNFGPSWKGDAGAIEICETLLTSFDVHTQVACLARMMELVMDPHAQLATGDEDEEASAALFRRLVKPNQVINRQEMILHLINTTVKSEAFLKGFLTFQYHTGRSVAINAHNSAGRHGKAKRRAKDSDADNDDDEEDMAVHDGNDNDDSGDEEEDKTAMAVDRAAERPTNRTNDACMGLLVSALELFAHYAELNRTTPANVDAPETNNKGREEEEKEEKEKEKEEAGKDNDDCEAKSYVMMLELLAGNTLACVLAGINEPTFVACLTRLLSDKRVVLQQKGLEVLLDRLHHALPALEFTVSDEDMEAHRRRLRDPRLRLTLMDLVRVKARPLVTKRSFALFEFLAAILRTAAPSAASLSTSPPASSSTSPVVDSASTVDGTNPLWSMMALCVACIEELVRIIAGGGSLQAEKTLLNTRRSDRVTAATLAKQFGSKSRVQDVERWLTDSLSLLPRLFPRAAIRATDGPFLFAAALLSAIGSVCQAMGRAFATPHSAAILDAVVISAVLSTAGVSPVASRGAAGSLARQAALGCLLRVLPSCWLMCQPHIPRVMFAALHVHNAEDAETQPRVVEVLAVLEALLEPQMFIEACTECLRGQQETKETRGARRLGKMRVRVETHSFPLLFASVRRRVEGLSRDVLQRIDVFMNGETPRDNFWLAALQALAAAPALPPHDIVQPVLNAYSAFFVKFKARQCTRLLSTVAGWAFANTDKQKTHVHIKNGDTEDTGEHDRLLRANDAEDDERVRDEEGFVSRATLHRWLLFFTLCGHLLEQLGSVMDFAFPIILPHIVSTLNTYCGAAQHAMRHAADLIARTLEGALDTARRIARAQSANHYPENKDDAESSYFSAPEVFNAIMPAVVRQLTNTAYLADRTHDYAFRAEHHVVPAVRAFFAALLSSRLQSKTQAEIVKALRHPSRHVRRAALLCLDGVYADGGDELASRLMAEMLPAVVEMTEDTDAEVVEQARRLCVNLSNITGQDVLYAMNNN